MSAAFHHRLRVRYVECDMQRVVFNAHYFTWLDIAHTALWQHAVGPLAAFGDEHGLDLVVAEESARFRRSARFDEEIDIAVTLDALGATSMTSRYTMTHEGTLLAEAWCRHVCVEDQAYTKRPWPEHVRIALAPYVTTGPPMSSADGSGLGTSDPPHRD